MTLSSRLPSRSILAAVLLPLLAACGPVVLANGGGSSTTSTTTSSHSTTTSSSTTGTGGQSPGNACTQAGGTCGAVTPGFCLDGTTGDPAVYPCGTGESCCLPNTCPDPCPVEMLNATQCAGSSIQTCQIVGSCSSWVTTAPCPGGDTCNSDGTKCISTPAQCTVAADCPCECTCTPQGVCGECTGAIPPSCTEDSQCGPVCAGYRCLGGTCQMK